MASYTAPVPCKVGDGVADIDTPALLLDLDVFEENLATMDGVMQQYPGVVCRPHAKAHKCPELAKIQMQHDVQGICCQTLVEAEALGHTGAVKDIFLTNQLIGKPKLRRFAALGKKGATLSVCVDDESNLRDISEVAVEEGIIIDCVVEVNVGQNRCGVTPGVDVAVLAKRIMSLPGVTLKGIQCYHGMNQHVRTPEDRQVEVDKVLALSLTSMDALRTAGIDCNYLTGGGTGTFQYEAKSGIFTEVQPGSYIFMDADYHRNVDETGKPDKEFKQSLFVLCTVQSVTSGVRAVVDGGMKALSTDSGNPVVHGREDILYECGGDEHGVLSHDGGYKVGDLVWMIPGHCDPTVNMFDWMVGVRGGKVECVWPVLGRGPGV